MLRTLIIVLLTASVSSAAESLLILAPDGPKLLRRTNGGLELVPYPHPWVDMRGNGSGDPGEPEPDPESTLTQQAKQWAAAINDTAGAQALALVYRQIGEAALSVDAALAILGPASDAALAGISAEGDWTSFRKHVTQAVAQRRQRGDLSTPQEMTSFLAAVGQGLELAADGSRALDFADILEIARRVNAEIEK